MLIYTICSAVLFVFILIVLICGKKNIRSRIRLFAIGLVFCDVIGLYPLTQKLNVSPAGLFLYAFQFGTLNADFSLWLKSLEEEFWLVKIYLSLIIYLTPFILGGVLLTFFEDALSHLRFFFAKRNRKIYYFSSLNKNSIELAKDIKNNEKKALIVFLNVVENELNNIDVNTKREFIFLSESESNISYVNRKGAVFFEISEDDNKNLADSMSLLGELHRKYKDTRLSLIKVYVFTEQKEAASVIVSEESKYINTILVNRSKYIAYSLLDEKPIYSGINQNNEINVLIIGCGNIGKEILKTSLWCGQLGDDYKLKIKIIDKKACYIESVLKREWPEIFSSGEYDISFYENNINCSDFEETIVNHCMDSNYIVVSTNDDTLNYEISSYLRALYLRFSDDLFYKPVIATLMIDDIKKENIMHIKDLDIVPFGSSKHVYSYKNLIESNIDKIGFNINSTYILKNNKNTSYEELEKSYFSNEINRQSSKANALHLKYKLFTLGYTYQSLPKKKSLSQLESSENYINEIISYKNDKDILTKLSKIEHKRWTAYERTEGLVGIPMDKLEKVYAITNSHKYNLAGMHGCICSWNELIELEKFITQKTGKEVNFRDLDSEFIINMLSILGLNEDKSNNFANVRNILVKL